MGVGHAQLCQRVAASGSTCYFSHVTCSAFSRLVYGLSAILQRHPCLINEFS